MWYPTKIDSTRDDGLFYVVDSTPAPFSYGVRLSAKETTLVFSLSFTARKAADLSQLICNKKVALAGSAPWGQFESYTFHTFRWFDGYPTALISAPHSAPLGTCLHLPTHTHFLRTAYRFVKVECIGRATDTNKQKQIDTVNTYNYIIYIYI